MLKKGMKIQGNPAGPPLGNAAQVQAAISKFGKLRAESSPNEKRAMAMKILRAAAKFNIVVNPGSLIGRLAGMK